MSITEAKTVISVTADTKDAVTEINKLAKAQSAQTEGLKKQAETTSLLGNKWEELSKGMVGLQLHDAFKRVAEGAKEATGGVVDLNMAFAGFKVAGPWGAAIGAVGAAALAATDDITGLKTTVTDLAKEAEAGRKAWLDNADGLGALVRGVRDHDDAMRAQYQRLLALPVALGETYQAFAKQRDIIARARDEIDKYNAAAFKASPQGNLASGLVGGVFGRDVSKPKKSQAGSKSWFNDSELNKLTDEVVKRLEAEQKFGAALPGIGDSLGIDAGHIGNMFGGGGDAFGAAIGSAGKEASTRDARYAKFNAPREKSFLESTFGTLDEFNGYKAAFDMLSGAVGASLTAWIDGSMSAGEAFKKFIGEALKGLAVQMAMEALKHGAYALGSLAFGNLAGAALHGKAALAFAAGAAITAGAAREFHSSAPSAASARPGAPNVSGGASGGGVNSTTIVYGDNFAEDSPRNRQLKAQKIIARAGVGNPAVEHR